MDASLQGHPCARGDNKSYGGCLEQLHRDAYLHQGAGRHTLPYLNPLRPTDTHAGHWLQPQGHAHAQAMLYEEAMPLPIRTACLPVVQRYTPSPC
mmetsp:Transcript_11364/g.31011  ORF Transcript_11364/g.31011 Transcript_11364/m.31011 type:complete len:95 (+) Transcript_11364:790-1074(+)|eukprot:scaffold66179_cov23-Tisochrysis_lutea.AAC.1